MNESKHNLKTHAAKKNIVTCQEKFVISYNTPKRYTVSYPLLKIRTDSTCIKIVMYVILKAGPHCNLYYVHDVMSAFNNY
jgi:hypothetical protein